MKEEDIKGIVLAGGSGTRLYPLTKSISKQLLPIYDKPMIYYPISVLMLAGIREILLITTQEDLSQYKRLLGDGSDFGIHLDYMVQPKPEGIAQAFLLAEDFINNTRVSLILGDNIFYGQSFTRNLESAVKKNSGATIFGYHVKDPERFGVVNLNSDGEVTSLEEKPNHPKSNYAITGLYFYDEEVVDIAKTIKPSERGELEITDINNNYLKKGNLEVEILGRGFTWLDTGTHDALLEANQFVQTVQKQGLQVACLEEIAYNQEWIGKDELIRLGVSQSSNAYGRYIVSLAKKDI